MSGCFFLKHGVYRKNVVSNKIALTWCKQVSKNIYSATQVLPETSNLKSMSSANLRDYHVKNKQIGQFCCLNYLSSSHTSWNVAQIY